MSKNNQQLYFLLLAVFVVIVGISFFYTQKKSVVPKNIQVVNNPPLIYQDKIIGFTLKYPPLYTVDPSYTYTLLGPDIVRKGVSFTVPSDLTTGTNLSKDTRVSVEHLDGKVSCSVGDFVTLPVNVRGAELTDGGTTYMVASTTDAGAGNRYEEYLYLLKDSTPCVAVRYFIHYSVLENYTPGSVTAFNKTSLLSTFDEVRRSLTLGAATPSQKVVHEAEKDILPLYSGAVWKNSVEASFADLTGERYDSQSFPHVTNIASVSTPFESYYKKILTSRGWREDINLAAGGPGSSVTSYAKGTKYIIISYKSIFSKQFENAPSECPCDVELSIFTGERNK